MAGKLASHYAGTSPEKIPFRLCCESLRAGDKIVSVGGDHELLWLRNTVLQSAGFKVLTTEDESTALEQISQMDCGVLLVCYSLPPPARNRLAKAFREKCPTGESLWARIWKLKSQNSPTRLSMDWRGQRILSAPSCKS